MTTPSGPAPAVGAHYYLTEADYKFGLGPLLARIMQVIGPVQFGEGGKNEWWWRVETACTVPGSVGNEQPRSLYVRAACLASAHRPPRG